MKKIAALLFLAFAIETSAAPMLRVTDVRNSHTIVVDNRGVAADIKLAEVLVAPSDEATAVARLRESVANSFVLIETDEHGDSSVYRSPDAGLVHGHLAPRAS